MRSIPAAKYVVFEHTVRQPDLHQDLQASLQYIWGTWLPRSKYEFTGAADFELYSSRFNPTRMTGVIELYIPVREK